MYLNYALLPAISIRECKRIFFSRIQQGHSSLADIMYPDGQAKELALSPHPGLELNAFVDMFRVESRDGGVVGDLFCYEGELVWCAPGYWTVSYFLL